MQNVRSQQLIKERKKKSNAHITFRCQRRCVYVVSVLARAIITTYNSFTIEHYIKFIDKQRGGQRFAIGKSNVIKTMEVCYFNICLFSAAAAVLCGRRYQYWIASRRVSWTIRDEDYAITFCSVLWFNYSFSVENPLSQLKSDIIIRIIDICILFNEVDNFFFTLLLHFKSTLTPLDKA